MRPRVRVQAGGVARLLEEEIAELLAKSAGALVWLVGPPGSGKSTALAHLAAVFAGEARLRLWDDEPFVPGADTIDVKAATVAAAAQPGAKVWRLATWSDDDCLEYLRAVHPTRVAQAFAAWQATTAEHDLLASPALCGTVLDRLAGTAPPADALQALHHICADEDAAAEGRLRSIALWAYRRDTALEFERARRSRQGRWRLLLRSRTAMALLAADVLVDSAVTGRPRPLQGIAWDRPLAIALMVLLQEEPRWQARLRAVVPDDADGHHALALSLLAVANAGFRPPCRRLRDLAHALLPFSDLAGKHLHGDCSHVHLAHASLQRAALDGCRLAGARLQGADLTDASMRDVVAIRVEGAGMLAPRVDAEGASFVGADLSGAQLSGARLQDAELAGARLAATNLAHADLSRARLDSNDLTTTDLDGAVLRKASLRRVQAGGVAWRDLDGEGSDWAHSDLTGSRLHGAQLHRASFRYCHLAEIDWRGADLRAADLTGAVFHLGNARSGLVDSTLASEGTRTGFYTDESLEEHWRQPEQVRKASLRDCDLRGAWLRGVDLYLVDLRGAKLDPEDRAWARRCRAILDAEGAA